MLALKRLMSRLSFKPRFALLIPIIVLVAIGVFLRSTKKSSPAEYVSGCVPTNMDGQPTADAFGVFDGQRIAVPSVELASVDHTNVLGVADPSERWIEIDLSDQTLRAWDGDQIYLETLVSTGLPGTPTPTGEFHVWVKMRATRMEGGEGSRYYNLPNVPYVMYLQNDKIPGWLGYGIHGTYWHNDFGSPRSHGCINLPTPVAEKLYYWAQPVLPASKQSVFASADNPGIRVVIHE